MKNKISTALFSVLSCLFILDSTAQATDKKQNSPQQEISSRLMVSELPVVNQATQARKHLYPAWSSSKAGLTKSPSGSQSEVFLLYPPSSLSDIRQEMARAASLRGEQEIQQVLETDTGKWPAIVKTVNMFANEPGVFFEPRPQKRSLERKVGLRFIETMDPWRLLFSLEDVRGFLSDTKGLRKSINGEDLSWVEKIYTQAQKRQVSWISQNRETLSSLSAIDGLPSFCPRRRGWKANPGNFIRKARLDVHRRTGFCDDISGRMSKVKPTDKKGLSTLFEEMVGEYDEILEGMARQPSQSPYVALMTARLAVMDPHSSYIPASNRSTVSARMNGAYVGIGVSVSHKGNKVSFAQVSPDGPAFEAGIRKGDALLALGTSPELLRPVEEFSPVQVTAMLAGVEGGMVTLRVRDSSGLISEKTVRRRRISLNDGRISISRIKDDINVLHVRVSGFYQDTQDSSRPGGSTASDLRRVLEASDEQDWILLDLRGNGGGLLSQAVEVASLFLPPGPVVQVQSTGGNTTTLSSKGQPVWTGPLAVLMDRSSASASEILAAALQDRGRAVILGERSFGKGTAQQQYDLDRWAGSPASVYGYLSLTTLRFFRPSGKTTQLIGVIPDIPFIPEMGKGREQDKEFVLRPTQLPSLLTSPQPSPWSGCYEDVRTQAAEAWSRSDWARDWEAARTFTQNNPIDLDSRRSMIENQKQIRDRLAQAVSKLPNKDAPLIVAFTSLSQLQSCTLSNQASSQENL